MWRKAWVSLEETALIALSLLCCLAVPAAALRYLAEMPAKVESGDEWHSYIFVAYITLDITTVFLLIRFRQSWVPWLLAASTGAAPFISIYLLGRS